MSWLKKWERQKRQQKMRRLTTSPTKRIKREVLRFFYRPSKVLAYCPTSNDESTSTYYVRNQSIDDTRKAHKLINVISREQTWTSEKWRTINILDDLRIKFNKNGSLIDRFLCQYPRSCCKDRSTMVGRSDFQQLVSRTYRLPPGKTIEKFMNELYDSFLVLGEFDKCSFLCHLVFILQPQRPFLKTVESAFEILSLASDAKLTHGNLFMQIFDEFQFDETSDTRSSVAETNQANSSNDVLRISISGALKSAQTKIQFTDIFQKQKMFCSRFQRFIWQNRRPSSRLKLNFDKLNNSMQTFDVCYRKMQLEVGLLQHQMKVRRKHFEAWWEEILWIREARRLQGLLLLSNKRRAVRKFKLRTNELKIIRKQKWIAANYKTMMYLRRLRNRAVAKREHRRWRLKRMIQVMIYRYHARYLLNVWNDNAQLMAGLDVARPYFDRHIKKKWFTKWSKYTAEEKRLLRVEKMRQKIREAERIEAEKDVDDQEAFFLTEHEQKQREKRLKEKAERLERERVEAMWAEQRHKAKGAAIKIRQTNEREEHKKQKKVKKKNINDAFFQKVRMKVMAAAEKEALEYLYETKNGKMLLKKLTKEVYDENNQECRARIHRGEGRVAESKWEAVEQGEGVMSIAAPIAYINESTMESFLFSKMTKKRAKAIATANFISQSQLNKIQAFDRKQEEDEKHFHMVDMATRIQARYRTKLGWRKAVKKLNGIMIKVYDTGSDSTYYYNTRDRVVTYEKPKLLGRRRDIDFLAQWQIKFDEETNDYVYCHRKRPWEKHSNKIPGLMTCTECNFNLARRRCKCEDCVQQINHSNIYTCFTCFDILHPAENENGTRKLKIPNICYRETEVFQCSICEVKVGDVYCRQCNFGDIFCNNCYLVIHSREEFRGHQSYSIA